LFAYFTPIRLTAYPKSYAGDATPEISIYPGGQTAPTPKSIGFIPGQMLSSVS
jgi:formate dehydrogenase